MSKKRKSLAKHLTEEQIEKFRNDPNVRYVDDHAIRFKYEFRLKLYEAWKAVRLHVHDYLLKPVSAKALQEAMTRASAYGQVIKEEEDVISPVTNYIREHLSEKISREQLADLVYLHPDYLTHVFKEKTGLSLSAYILKERLKQSKNLLRNTDKSINTIALDCGFSDASYFTRIFRRETGISPRQYREGQ